MNAPIRMCLAVDIGGTKCAAGIVSSDGRVLARRQIPTAPDRSAEDLFGRVARLVSGVLDLAPGLAAGPDESGDVSVCGVGCGGPMSPGGEEVSPLNIPAWRGFPLRRKLSELTGLTVGVDNDAKALALAEGWVGGARGQRNFLAMVVSTGVGGGIVLDGRLLEGHGGNAGHVGHVVVEPAGRRCSCGGQGCLEAEASGTAIAAVTGKDPSVAPPEVVERTGRMVGRAVASVCNLLDLQLAIVSGSVALGFGSPFFQAAREELAVRARLDFSRSAEILESPLGADGPLVGAAAVGWSAAGLDVLGANPAVIETLGAARTRTSAARQPGSAGA